MAKNSELITLETAKEILTQITNGLTHCHDNKIVHGNLTCSQITIIPIIDGGSFTAKIAKFLTAGKLIFDPMLFDSETETYQLTN